jgi:hypothetical protein
MRVYRNIHSQEPDEGSFLIAEVLCEFKTLSGEEGYLVEYGKGTLIPILKKDACIKKKKPKLPIKITVPVPQPNASG